MFAGEQTEEREVPHERGNHFTFRNLSGPELDEADVAGTRRAAEEMKVLPDAIVNRAMAERGDGETPRDEFRGYDKPTLVRYGVQSWHGPRCDGVKCDDEGKAKLDARTLDWAARQVFEMNVRPEGEGRGSGSESPIPEPAPSRMS